MCHLPRTQESKIKIAAAQIVAVSQYDLDGKFIETYSSMIQAEEATGIMRQGISRCCRFPHRSARGYRFSYADKSEEKR